MNTNEDIKNKISDINITNNNLQDRLNDINNLYNKINNDNTMMEKKNISILSPFLSNIFTHDGEENLEILFYIKKLSNILLYIKITLFIITIFSISLFFVIFRKDKKENN